MKHLKTIISVLVILASVSCVKTPSAGCGQVSFGISSDQQVTDMTRSNVADYTTNPSPEDFTIEITGPQDYNWKGKISEWNVGTLLLEGEYSVIANYGTIEEEGYDKPFYTGAEAFEVAGGQTTQVSVPVSLGNTIVKLSYSEAFQKYFNDYSFKFSRSGFDIATVSKDETRAVFVDGYMLTLSGELESESKIYSFSRSYSDLNPATAYTFNLDVSNVGVASITITFKEGYSETIDLGNLELND